MNNFNLAEGNDFMTDLNVLRFSYSIANRSTHDVALGAQIVGFAPDNQPIFATSASPYIDIVGAGRTEDASSSVYIAPGELLKATRFCIRVGGNVPSSDLSGNPEN